MEPFHVLRAWLDGLGVLVGSDLDGNAAAINSCEPNFVIALGGDGTILHAGQAMQRRQVPIIGVNLGKLGYMADFDVAEMQSLFPRLVSDSSLINRRMILEASVTSPDGDIAHGIALNDVVVRVGDPFRTIMIDIEVDGSQLCRLAGDGVILATPTGSTAHNMSCGGPVVEPGMHAIVITPRCAHSFTHRPIVVGGEAKVRVRMVASSAGSAAVLDGQRIVRVGNGSQIDVCRSDLALQLVRHPDHSRWHTLVHKLKWGMDVT
jgi:NAD+ kinase